MLLIACNSNGHFYTRGHIVHRDKLSSVVGHSRWTMEDNSSRHIMRLVPIFSLETHNQTNNECLPKFVQTDNASSSIKMANILFYSLRVYSCIQWPWFSFTLPCGQVTLLPSTRKRSRLETLCCFSSTHMCPGSCTHQIFRLSASLARYSTSSILMVESTL